MIVFELTMPNIGSWNNRWSGSGRRYIRCRANVSVPKNYIGKNYEYSWPDGWTACVSVFKTDSRTARKLEKQSAGFSGYDWMIASIIRHGYITPEDIKKEWE